MIFGYSLPELIVIVVSILIGMTVHEASHAYVSLRLGDATAAERGRISLNPLNHIDPYMTVILPVITLILFHSPILAARPVPFNPERVKYDEFGAALIAFAGPLSNLVLAIFGAIILHVFASNSTVIDLVFIFVSLNVALFVFNLIPVPPLDGSRVLYAFAPQFMQQIMRRLESLGLILVLLLVLIGGFDGVLSNINGAILHLLLR